MEKTLKILNELQRSGLIEKYTIGGGITTIYYVEPILTYDLDVFIVLPEKMKTKNLIVLSPIFEYLEDMDYQRKGEHIIIEGLPVQFIPADTLEEDAVTGAKEIEYEGVKTRVLTPEYLISLQIRAGRKKDIDKTEKLLEQAQIDMKKLKDILQKYNLSRKFDLL